ncbi:MAG: type II toxin-antitoxin system HicB family antitoxin [Patescibacteria group bacterium]
MISEFVAKKLKAARYKLLKDGSYFGEIPGLKGVWANAKNLEECREELKSALEDWMLFKLKEGDAISGLRIGIDRRRLVKTHENAR